ncbi:hypothetical protein SIO70_23080 [Chitinophaga sancti]|uniref:hypothetical protein n=1 Tax=Chitinophaga sancti TaxID=1004 RepID=UPI002A750E9E|nr:hypothetical protein [Chitinophaga sancti]WPQ61247.1 hypothetical protein SIO70_23080 [Chitinophaga sancti]
MKKISVKDLVAFRKKSDRGKKSFVENIKSSKIEVPAKGGGDYWISSLSAISKSYKEDDLDITNGKIKELQKKIKGTKHRITKDMYQRNISILERYKNLDPAKIRVNGKLSFLKKSSGNPLLTIKGLQIETKPSLIYTFGSKGENIGAIWFTAKVEGYKIEEISIFCDVLYRFLKHNYSKKYQIASRYCIAVDMISGNMIDFSDIESGSLAKILPNTLDEISKLM